MSPLKKICASLLVCLLHHYVNAQVPQIESFTPASARVGETIIISGANFSTDIEDIKVFFRTISATVVSAAEDELEVIVPNGIISGPLTVLSDGLSSTSKNYFNLLFEDSPTVNTASFQEDIRVRIFTDFNAGIMYDMNQDGKVDIVHDEPRAGEFTAYINNLSDTLTFLDRPFGTLFDNNSLHIKDLNGDGLPEVVFNDDFSTLYVRKNSTTDGNLSYASAQAWTSISDSRVFASSLDFDGDGRYDVFLRKDELDANQPENIQVFRNTSSVETISFADPIIIEDIFNSSIIFRFFDFNDDKLVDIITLNQDLVLKVYYNSSSIGTIQFDEPQSVDLSGAEGLESNSSFGLFDLTDNQIPELIFWNDGSAGKVSMIEDFSLDMSEISLDQTVDLSNSSGLRSMEIHDLNGDGRWEITGIDGTSTKLTIISKSDSESLSFEAPTFVNLPSSSVRVRIGDLNLDALPDLAIYNNANNSYYIMLNAPEEVVLSEVDLSDLIIYPNPFTDQITVSSSNIREIWITDMRGVRLLESKELTLSAESLTTGSYILHILTDDGNEITRLVVKQ